MTILFYPLCSTPIIYKQHVAMYTATKHYGKKTGQFKTVLGYVTDEKVKRIRDMRTNEYLPCSQCYPTTPLMYLLLFKQSKATVWEIIRVLPV